MNTLMRVGILLGGGALSGLAGNALHPSGLRLTQPVLSQAEIGQCSGPGPQGANPPAPTLLEAPEWISVQQALSLRGTPGLIIGDLRPPKDYAQGHITNAIHLPCSGALGEEAFNKIPSGGKLLLYDADGQSPQLQQAATTALIRGLPKVYLLQGGFAGWTLAALPAESGTCERCPSH